MGGWGTGGGLAFSAGSCCLVPWPLSHCELCARGCGPWAETFSRQAGAALSSTPAQFSLLLLKMSTSYLARIFPDLENSIKQLSNT